MKSIKNFISIFVIILITFIIGSFIEYKTHGQGMTFYIIKSRQETICDFKSKLTDPIEIKNIIEWIIECNRGDIDISKIETRTELFAVLDSVTQLRKPKHEIEYFAYCEFITDSIDIDVVIEDYLEMLSVIKSFTLTDTLNAFRCFNQLDSTVFKGEDNKIHTVYCRKSDRMHREKGYLDDDTCYRDYGGVSRFFPDNHWHVTRPIDYICEYFKFTPFKLDKGMIVIVCPYCGIVILNNREVEIVNKKNK